MFGVFESRSYQTARQNSQTHIYRENEPTGLGAEIRNFNSFLPGENSVTPNSQDYTHILSRVINAIVGPSSSVWD